MLSNLFNFNALAIISTTLILIVSAVVIFYAKTYLRTDEKRNSFLISTTLIAISLIITFASNNIILLLSSWMISNLLLVKIMIHKSSWKQALNSGLLTLKNFTIGFIALAAALTILYAQTKTYLISDIISNNNISSLALNAACLLILIAALSQSAIYPFSSWIISSLNSPTPTSALMHAGLVNGGGIILAKFAPLFFKTPNILIIAFILGITSVIIGTFWKLIQGNVKSMLACSTMSQMGFVIAQCSMGLFAAAIAHLFWHGLFKSYLFLSSAGSGREKRLDLKYPPNLLSFILSLICGVFGAVIFAKISHIKVAEFNTNLVLVAICFVAASQIGLTIMNDYSSKKRFFVAIFLCSFLSAVYASLVVTIEKLMPANLLNAQDLNFWHVIAVILLFAIWLIKLFWINNNSNTKPIFLKLYMKALNASQPSSNTITSNRNQYNYK